MFDIIVIGRGPAGVSAALYTVRANLSTLLLGSGSGALETAERIDNYYGFPGGISGGELQRRGVEQARLLGCEVLDEEVTAIAQGESGFVVRTNRGEHACRQILITTGKSRNRTKIPGVEAYLGRGISMCAVCDGFLYRGKRLAVLGSANYALAETGELTRFSKDITICTNGREPAWEQEPPEGVRVDTRPIREIAGGAKVERVAFADGEELAVDGVFIAEGTASALDFAVKLGIFTEGSDIVVDEHYRTNVEGIYAAGDCVGGFLQISKAVADGALAAKAMIKHAPKG